MVDSVIRFVKLVLRVAESTWFYARSIWRKLLEDDVLFLASGLAFNGIFTMIPMLFLSAAAIGALVNSYALGMTQVNEILDTAFPAQPFALQIREAIGSMVADIVTYRKSIGIVGLLVLIWTGTSLFDALRSALHRIYELKRTRGLMASFMHDIGFMTVAFILFMAVNFSLWVYTLLKPLAGHIPFLVTVADTQFTQTIPTMIIVLLTAVMFYIIFGHITDVKPPREAALISSFITTVLWVIGGRVFALYISDWSIIGRIYGPYAFMLVLLLWIYLSSLLFVFGGIVGQVYWERKRLREAGLIKSWVEHE
jgi:membrane protein